MAASKVGNGTPAEVSTTDDLYVTGSLEVAGAIHGDGSGITGITSTQVDAVPLARTIYTTAPLRIDGGASADLSNYRTLSVSAASDTAAGVVELATNAETITGTDTARATTPSGVAAAVSTA